MTRTKAQHQKNLLEKQMKKARQRAALVAIMRLAGRAELHETMKTAQRETAFSLIHWITANETNGNLSLAELEELRGNAWSFGLIDLETSSAIHSYSNMVHAHRESVAGLHITPESRMAG